LLRQLLVFALGVEIVQVECGHHVLLFEEKLLDLAVEDGRDSTHLLSLLPKSFGMNN